MNRLVDCTFLCLCMLLSLAAVLSLPMNSEESGVRMIDDLLPMESRSALCLSLGKIILSEEEMFSSLSSGDASRFRYAGAADLALSGPSSSYST